MTQTGEGSHFSEQRFARFVPLFLLLLLLLFQVLVWLVMRKAHVQLTIQGAVISFGVLSILGGRAAGMAQAGRRVFLTFFEMSAFVADRREVIVDVEPAQLEQIFSDFVSEGADVAAVRQPDGHYGVQALFFQAKPDETIDAEHEMNA